MALCIKSLSRQELQYVTLPFLSVQYLLCYKIYSTIEQGPANSGLQPKFGSRDLPFYVAKKFKLFKPTVYLNLPTVFKSTDGAL